MPHRPLRTKSGHELTAEDLAALAHEARVGYDLTRAKRRRVGRPSLGESGPSPRVSVRVDPSAYDELRELADAEDTTVSAVARRLLEAVGAGSPQGSAATEVPDSEASTGRPQTHLERLSPDELPAAPFEVGQVVAVRADPTRSGPVIAALTPVGGRGRFRVYHSPTVVRDYFEEQLVAAESTTADGWIDLLERREFVDPPLFSARLTATRLNNPQTDHIYALRAARIQFIPFQFKPLVRLLHADRPRLLIADDVGVGKTIEAGLILKELSTRQQLDRILVLCPKALTVKWRAEMRRFDESFRILSPESLRYCLDEVARDGEWPAEYARAIVHYELFRMEQYLQGTSGRRHRHHGLLELEPPPQFNLVIADEAHHLRTPETSSHALVEHLCLNAEAVLMLSATPVQLHSDNLFTLLHLLQPELFPDKSVFHEVLEPNAFITAAARTLRAGPSAGDNWLARTNEALNAAERTAWGRAVLSSDPNFRKVVARVGERDMSDEKRVRCIRDLEELNSLAHVMNRTRRRDIGYFTIREPRTVSVPFTTEQRRLYDAVLVFRREVLLLDYDPQVVRLILDTLERQAASSINALHAAIDEILAKGGIVAGQITDDPDADDTVSLPGPVLDCARDVLTAARELPDEDPKLQSLLDVVSQTTDHTGGPGKVLVFSFFLRTIDYLQKCLSTAGVRVGVVTGQVEDEEREELRDRFRRSRDDPTAIDVLLSSEVGCEGLDYEFCDTLVNYDIPWNPMRIEQRIGRIDRFGQRSPKVLIFNFITPDTIEERVFFRCYERLGVFRDTVGDLEDVLGELVQDLNRIALDTSLTPEQAEARARQVADNAIRLADEQRRLDAESEDLLGLDDAFIETVDEVVASGRFVSPADLRSLVDVFLVDANLRGLLSAGPGHVHRLRIPEAGRRELAARLTAVGVKGPSATGFLRALDAPEGAALTFDQDTAAERRDIEFVTPVHPLARAAASHWNRADRPLVGGLRLRADDVKPGVYLFVCEMRETIAVRPDLRLECLAISLEDGAIEEELSRRFVALVGASLPMPSDVPYVNPDTLAERLHDLDALSDATRRQAIGELKVQNEALLVRRLASLESFHAARRRQVEAEISAATEPRIVRMKGSQLARIDADYESHIEALKRARQVEIVSRRVAAGLVEVVGAAEAFNAG